MKDERLEQQFKEYFDGIELPELPNNIVTDAKKSVKRRNASLPRFAKIASVAASFVLVFAVAAVLIARADFSASEPNGSGADVGQTVSTYDASLLRFDEANAYALSEFDEDLKFIENLAYRTNAEVKGAYISRFADETTAFVYAQVTLLSGARYDAEIYVEYAEETFEPLKDFAGGATGTYRGISYRLTREIAENGEPLNKLLCVKNGIKYYFSVQSSDENSYLKYLELLLEG